MSLVVGTNTSAQFAQDALRANQNKIATAMQRLSTGLRINSARDDAAGLAISQSMTSQIRGLNQAVRNINDGVNLLQTAEGGLSSITDMLQRMRELAVQSANGTNSDAQRAYLQKEAAALQEQIGKVVDTTTWNDKKLLDGSFTGQKIQAGADSGAMMDLSISSAMAVVGGARTFQAVITGNDVGANPLAAGELAINGTAIDSAATASAKDVAAAINLQSVATGVTAAANATTAPAAAIAVAAASVTSPMPGEVSVAVSPPMVSESGSGNLTFTFTRGGDISNALTVNIGIGGTTTATDYTSNSLVPTVDNSVAWSRFAGDGAVSSLATASDGTVIAVGMTNGPLDGQLNPGGTDAFIIKYATDGTKMWTRLLGSSGLEVARAAATGPDGSAYIVGYTDGSFDGQSNSFNGRIESFVSKFDSNGTKLWTRLFGGVAHTVTVGQDGEIYFGGNTGENIDGAINGGRSDSFITKFSPDGTKQWTRLDGKSVGDYGYAMTAGLDGGIYLTGAEAGIPAMNNAGYTPMDAFITKYTASGIVEWSTTVGSGNESRAITTGLDGSIYVGGWTNVSFDGQTKTNDGEHDGWVCKYSPNGTKLWTRMVGGLNRDGVFSLTAGLDGAIYVGGNTATIGSVTKMMPDGTKVWTKIIGGTQENQGGITTGLDGAIYFASNGNMTDTTTGTSSSGGFITKLPVRQPTITFPAGSATASLIVNPVADNLAEGSESLSVTLLPGAGYSLNVTTTTATGIIIDGAAYTFGAIASDAIRINGTNIGAIATAVSGNERANQMLTAINAQTSSTGVIATINVATGGISLTAADGRNIAISTLTSAQVKASDIGIVLNGTASGNRTITTYRSSVSLNSTSQAGLTISASGAASAASGLTSGITAPNVYVSPPWDIGTAETASSTIGAIDTALDSINSTRATLGSYINRLAYAADNATNISTNLSASRSTIMDADYAEESANLAKSQIIQQAATAMLAQANQQPQSVLALLKNL